MTGGNPCKRHAKCRDAIATGASDAERTRAASPCPARIVTRLKLEQDLLSRAPGLARLGGELEGAMLFDQSAVALQGFCEVCFRQGLQAFSVQVFHQVFFARMVSKPIE